MILSVSGWQHRVSDAAPQRRHGQQRGQEPGPGARLVSSTVQYSANTVQYSTGEQRAVRRIIGETAQSRNRKQFKSKLN